MLQEEGIKEREDLLEQISVLKSNIDDNEDIKKAKQRQLDRLSEDNDSLVEQINTYSSQLRIITKEKTKTEEDIKATKDALKALEEILKLSEKKHANDQKLVHSGIELGRMKELLEEKESNVGHLESVRFHIEKENVEITQKKHRFD